MRGPRHNKSAEPKFRPYPDTQGHAGEIILHPFASPLPNVLVQSEGMKLLNETQILVFAVVMEKHICYVLNVCRLILRLEEGEVSDGQSWQLQGF